MDRNTNCTAKCCETGTCTQKEQCCKEKIKATCCTTSTKGCECCDQKTCVRHLCCPSDSVCSLPPCCSSSVKCC